MLSNFLFNKIFFQSADKRFLSLTNQLAQIRKGLAKLINLNSHKVMKTCKRNIHGSSMISGKRYQDDFVSPENNLNDHGEFILRVDREQDKGEEEPS